MKLNVFKKNQIKIGNRSYAIAYLDDESFNVYLSQKNVFDEDIKSFIDYDEQIIAIRNSLKIDHQQELLVHELLHACFDDSGVEQDENVERFIKILAPRITCMLTTNFE